MLKVPIKSTELSSVPQGLDVSGARELERGYKSS